MTKEIKEKLCWKGFYKATMAKAPKTNPATEETAFEAAPLEVDPGLFVPVVVVGLFETVVPLTTHS